MSERNNTLSTNDATILVVDDTPQNLKLMDVILSQAGYQVVRAGSAAEAYKALATSLPDLILLDVVMPDTDGYSVCLELKSRPETSGIPIIFLSGLSEPTDKVKGFSAGGADYVTKPFHSAEVLARVTHHVRMVRLQQQLALEKEQLSRANTELVLAQHQTEEVFAVLTQHLRLRELDGKYVLQDKIGSGGSGVVFRAIRLDSQQPVAVKIFRPVGAATTQQKRDRFRLEGISARRLCHANAVAILDSGTSPEGVDYLVMELLSGHPLSDELKSKQPLPLGRCLQVIIPVCRLLIAAHDANVVHRDVKPENIFLHHGSSGEIVKVLDFGIAKLIGEDALRHTGLTSAGTIIGTPLYMSPEQLKGELCDGRADVYSVGVVLYELLSGDVPFPSTESLFSIIFAHLSKPLPSLRARNPAVPEAIERTVMAALVKNPLQRPTAREFLAELLRAAAEVLGDEALDALLTAR